MGLFIDFIKFLFNPKGLKIHRVSAQTILTIQNKWRVSIDLALKTKKPSQLRQALITADKLLDAALKDVSTGENMGERLKNAQKKFDWAVYDKLWKAHKVRNALVHDVSYEPTYFVLEEALTDFKKGLESLGVYL